jgi:hypothetical protein
MTDSFVVHLGGGAYLDASGNITFGLPTGIQVYEKPGGFHVDTKKIQDALKDLSGLLPSSDADKEKWEDWGVPKKIVNFLGSVSGAAGIMATAGAVYMWGIGIAIGLLNVVTKGDGLSPELAAALLDFRSQLKGQEEINRATKMIQLNANFKGRLDRLKGILLEMEVQKMTGVPRLNQFIEMQALMDELAVPLSELMDQDWTTTYNPDDYKGRAFASKRLFFVRPDGTLASVPMSAPNITAFDYRLGAPMLLFGATVFVAIASAAMPWFRSAGRYASQLRSAAEAIDRFVLRAQSECLARTNYSAQTIFEEKIWSVFQIPAGGGPRSGWVPETDLGYAVGAFDLVQYNDAFLVDRHNEQMAASQDPEVRGLFNYGMKFATTDLQEIADAANEQAKQDYANLQTATGMLRLVSTSALLRFLSTPPRESQTIKGRVRDSRILHDSTSTMAKSPSIHPVGVIEHAATLSRYNARARASINTQEPGYSPPFRYRVLLRTIDSKFGMEGWTDRKYVGDVWEPDYVPVQGDPRLKRLKSDLVTGFILSEVLLHEGVSPPESVVRSGHARLTAATFDWYVPVLNPWSSYSENVKELAKYAIPGGVAGGNAKKEMLGSGGVSFHLIGQNAVDNIPIKTLDYSGPLLGAAADANLDLSDFTGLVDTAFDKAERRHVSVEEVDVDWQLNWADGNLEVRLFGAPGNRPFQLHVVVEETVYSGEIVPDNPGDILANQQLREHIHTPFVAEMVNQVVYVPEEFFDKEREAIVESARLWREFLRRFAEVGPIGPGDPIEFLHQSIGDLVKVSPSTSTLAATIDKRVEFAMREAPELWERATRNTRRGPVASSSSRKR